MILTKEIAILLGEKKFTLALAESCTGGFLANSLTNVPGSSNFFHGGIITYTKKSKENLLEVNSEIIKKNTVYSEVVAKRMAENVRDIFDSTIGISTTGIAPPGDKTSSKQTGLVFIGFSFLKQLQCTKIIIKTDNRIKFKELVCKKALVNLKTIINAQ